ncbi:thiamine-phosphate kinase [Arsenicicoccus dermatophilus]|uniref:thiamine-phosphate kinase n=1 Tax=Arsenicicoccus dermatophilus TaxID=1076331 RepID=UPI003916D51D
MSDGPVLADASPARPLWLRDLSEEELLARILPVYAAACGREGDILLGPGDDAAVVAAPSGSVVATTDTMVLGHDWRDDWSSPQDVGHKLVTQNVADVAAMGARPTGLLVTLAAHRDLEVAWVEGFAHGIARAAAAYDVTVVGGDLSGAPEGVIVVTITALGDLEGREPVRRSGARPGDLLAVHGSLGESGAGWWLYEHGYRPDHAGPWSGDGEPTPQWRRAGAMDHLMGVHRTPVTHPGSGALAARAGATAMIDLSDGLVRDAGRIARASGVRIDLDGEALQRDFVAPLVEVLPEGVAWQQVLTGGEEHSLVATVPADSPLLRDQDDPDGRWWVIGRVLPFAEEEPAVTLDGAPVSGQGWDHFGG